MNKKEFVAALAEKSGVAKADVASVVDAVSGVIEETVMDAGETIRVVGLGNISRKDSAARTARNPRTGADVQVPAKQKPVFKLAKTFDR